MTGKQTMYALLYREKIEKYIRGLGSRDIWWEQFVRDVAEVMSPEYAQTLINIEKSTRSSVYEALYGNFAQRFPYYHDKHHKNVLTYSARGAVLITIARMYIPESRN